MDLDALLFHYFGTTDLETLDPGAIEYGVERLGTAFWTERDGGRRFALWALLYMLGSAPDLDVAFKEPADRDAARTFMETVERAEEAATSSPQP